MNKTISPFDTRERFTKVHNYVIDEMMPTLKPNAFKVLVFIIRKTRGWGKDADCISYSQLRTGTGIASDATLRAALQELEGLQYILCDKTVGLTNSYMLNTTLEIVVPPTSTVFDGGTSTETVVPTSTETVDTKEKTTKDKERQLKASADVPLSGAPPSSDGPVKIDYKELPPVKAYRDLHNRWPSMAQMKLIDAAAVSDLGLWVRVLTTWAGRGYKPNNIEGQLEWYRQPSRFEKRETKPQRTTNFVPPVATGETGNVYSRFAA